MEFDKDGRLIHPFAGQKTKTWSEIKSERRYEEDKQKWKEINEQTKPWTNNGKQYTDEEFYKLVESCSPGLYLDYFSRTKRKGWYSYGINK